MSAEHPIAPPSRDPAVFAVFYRQQFDTVLGFVARRTDSVHLAADLTADTFLAALEQADSYDARRGAPVAWLYGISRNVLASYFRGSVRELHAVARIAGRRMLDDQDVSAIEARIDAAREARGLAARHAALSEPLRAVLDLVAVDGLTVREAAHALGISAATADERRRCHQLRRYQHVRERSSGGCPVTAPLNFQQRLGAELAARAADLPATGTMAPVRPRHTRRLVATGFGLAAAVTAVALVPHTGAGRTGPAPQAGSAASQAVDGGSAAVQLSTASYTVTPNQDGTISFQLIGADWTGLQSALRSLGVPALVMTPSDSCHTPVVADSSKLESVMSLDPKNGRIAILHPAAIPPGENLLLVNTALKGGLQPAIVGNVDISLTKQTPSCFPVAQNDGVGVG